MIDAISIIVCLFAVIVVTAVDALVAVIIVVINDYSIVGFDPVRSSMQTFVSATPGTGRERGGHGGGHNGKFVGEDVAMVKVWWKPA